MSIKKISTESILLLSSLIVFYIFQFFGNKLLIFSSYILFILFQYLINKDIRRSIVSSLVLAVFSEAGFGISLFKMEPSEFNPDSGWWFSPMTMLILAILPLSLRRIKLKKKVYAIDFLVTIFFLWNCISLYFFPNSENVMYALINLFEISIAYYVLRMNLEKSDKENLVKILISVLVFQSILGLTQFILGSNIGTSIENANELYPYGLTTVEDENLFRITGSYGHANLLAVCLVTLLPFLFYFKRKTNFLLGLAVSAVILTLSRVAWFTVILMFLYIFLYLLNKENDRFRIYRNFGITVFIVLILFSQIILSRLNTLPDSFSEGSSWDTRQKIWQEAWNLLEQYPISGTGQNRFIQLAFENQTDNFYPLNDRAFSYKIHNLFLEIAAETGIIGLYIFILFLVLQYYYLLKIKNRQQSNFYRILLLSLSVLLFISMFNPLFLTSLFRIYFLLPTLIFI